MILKTVKVGLVAAAGLAVIGGVLFGTEAFSYLRSSAGSVRTAVKDSVPIEFELRRARDMLDGIIPEMHANVRLIAQEEVEVAGLKSEIQQCSGSLDDERIRITKLRDMLDVQKASYTIGGYDYTRSQVKEELARQFDRFKEAEVVLAGKKRLLTTRERSLQAAMDMLDRTRAQKVHLEDQIEALEGQYRLVKAASAGSAISVDHSKIAQTEKLLGEIKNRLDVAERVLAHEARFVQPIKVDVISEADLVTQVDEYFAPVADDAGDQTAESSDDAGEQSLTLSRADD